MTDTLQTVEVIHTGLTRNYIHYFTVEMALKEAMQNIAYGVMKSGKEAKIYRDEKAGMVAIRDFYEGFEKKHLYIGESGQRDDDQGLGTFGEGWKIFLLVMAREGIAHKVQTTGFTFYGKIELTEHGTEVLNIYVEENSKTSGTKVLVDVEPELVLNATKSFAVLCGISKEYLSKDTFIPDRFNELWVHGVRIESEDNTNPLSVYYSYNLQQRDLINRDRSHANTEKAYVACRRLIFNLETIEEIKDYIHLAQRQDNLVYQDIVRGPYVPISGESEQKNLWLKALADFHGCEEEDLVIASTSDYVNQQLKKSGFVPVEVPSQWNFELKYLGIKEPEIVLNDKYDVVEVTHYGTSREEKSALAKAKVKMKKLMGYDSVDYLPEIRYVDSIRHPMHSHKELEALYDSGTNIMFLKTSILGDEKKIIRAVLPELAKMKYGAETDSEINAGYENMIISFLFK